MSSRALEALDRILDEGGEPDDVLRSTVRVLSEEPGIVWAGIAFLDEGTLTLGPHIGAADETRRQCVAITYRGSPVGELWVDGDADAEFLQRVAALVSVHVLIGWDTQGETWEP